MVKLARIEQTEGSGGPTVEAPTVIGEWNGPGQTDITRRRWVTDAVAECVRPRSIVDEC